MGHEMAEAGTDDSSATRWNLQLNSGHRAGGVLAAGAAAVAPASAPDGRRLVVEAWSAVGSWFTWLRALTVSVALVLVLGFIHPAAYDFPTLRATAEAVMVLLVLTAALLLWPQFAHARRLRDLLLLAGLVVLALIELVANALPAALHLHANTAFRAVTPLGQLIAAAILAAAAFTPSDRLITDRRRAVSRMTAACAISLGIAELVGLALHNQLMAGTVHALGGIDGLLARPVGLLVLALTTGLLVYTASEFARQGRRREDEVLTLLAGAVVLLAGARLYYLALASVSPEVITSREGLRLAGFALLLAAMVRQDREIRKSTTRAAAIAERRRVAEDLHDGLAQDLAFIAAYGGRLAQDLGGEEHPVAVAARRALAVSRDAISELSDMSDTPPLDALEAIAQELRARFEIAIAVNAHPDAEVSPIAKEHVARIVREAIANAARHGHAQNVVVSLRRTASGTSVRVCDDGCGIRRTPGGSTPEGFGLRSIHERAAACGGHMTVRQRRAGGTELEVVLP